MQKKTTMADVASAAGVTKATVSLALNDHPRISTETKKRILKICEDLGYTPNLIAKALAQSGTSVNEARFLGTIGILESCEFATRRERTPYSNLWEQQLTQTCTAMGYKLDRFVMGSSEKEQRAINRILQARGITGIFIYGYNEAIHEWALDWDRFAAVAYSSSLHEHFIHNVMSNSYQDVFEATIRLLDRGYQRPGYFRTYSGLDQWDAGFNSALQTTRGGKQQVPNLSIPDFLKHAGDTEKFLKWYSRHKPDVILANFDNRLLEILDQAGIRVPEDVGFLCLDVWEARLHMSGLRQLRDSAFQVALDLLHSMLMRNEFGPPKQPICVQIPSVWNEGETLRAEKSA